TAIIAAAGLINALDLTGRDIKSTKLVCNGAGAAGIACLELLKAIGFTPNNIILCDTKGVIYQGRTEGMNQWKSAHAVKTSARTLAAALAGADVFFGLSVKGAVTKEMVKSMAPKPIIFAMANPDPEISAEEVAEVRNDAIMATGRSDYPNQINNVLGFPYIFRGALDVRATAINMEMKIAAAKALAALAREDVPDEVAAAYGIRPKYGPEYIIPVPFDPRLISFVPRWRPPPWIAASPGVPSSTWTPIGHSCARGAIRSPASSSASTSGCAAGHNGSFSPKAKRSRSSVPPRASSSRVSGRHCSSAARTACARARARWASNSAAASRSSTRACRSATRRMPPFSTSACSATAFSSVTSSAW